MFHTVLEEVFLMLEHVLLREAQPKILTNVQQSNSKKHVFQHKMVNIEHAFTFAQRTKYKFYIVFYFCILLYTLDSGIRNVCYPSMQE